VTQVIAVTMVIGFILIMRYGDDVVTIKDAVSFRKMDIRFHLGYTLVAIGLITKVVLGSP
jgi:hypothetical protein